MKLSNFYKCFTLVKSSKQRKCEEALSVDRSSDEEENGNCQVKETTCIHEAEIETSHPGTYNCDEECIWVLLFEKNTLLW